MTVHDLGFAARTADRVVVMADGRILADGRADAAMTPEVLAQAYGVRARWLPGDGGPVLDLAGRHG